MRSTKTKRITLPLGSRRISLNRKKDFPKSSKSPLASPTNSKLPPQQRSTSLDQSLNHNSSDKFKRSSSEGQKSCEEAVIELLPIVRKEQKNSAEAEASETISTQSQPIPVVQNGFKSSDHVDPMTGCSNIERKSSVVLNAADKAKFEKALSQLTKRHLGTKKRLIRKGGKAKSRSRSRSTTESENEKVEKKTKRGRKRSMSESGIDLALIKEYDIIAVEDIQKIEESFHLNDRDERQQQMPIQASETSDGIIQIQNGLFKLLRDFILILPDNAIEEVLSHYVTLDIVIVLANNPNASVRASIIRLLTVMCDRYTVTNKAIYFYHLGNQISLHPTEFSLVHACVQWVTGSCINLDQMVNTQDNDIKVMQKCGLNSLIAVLPQTMHDINLAKSLMEFMNQLYRKADGECCAYMVEYGLLPSVIKSLSRVYIKWVATCEKLIDTIQTFMCTIALKALGTAGTINVLWDLLNGLTYVEQNKTGSTFRGLRTTQAGILQFLLNSFFARRNNPTIWNFKFNISEINLPESILSTTEKRTRFELLVDRIVQFLRNVHWSHVQSPQEIKLIESIVMLSVSGCHRGSVIIPWCFRPGKPMPLKLYIIKLMWKQAKNGDLPLIGCDGKMVKSMIHAFLHSDREIIPAADMETLLLVCKALGIQPNSANSYLSQAIEKIDTNRESSLKEQKPSIERSVFKFEQIAQNCIDSAMKITRNVVELQNAERRNAMTHIRVHDESCLNQEWNLIIDRMTHEGAPWHCSQTYPSSWELDHTEGPSRMRIRLKRCQLNILPKFFQSELRENVENKQTEPPLAYLTSTLTQRPSCTLSDQVLHTFPCNYMPVDSEVDGEMIITDSNLIFIPNKSSQNSINIEVSNITDIWLRRYQHKETALEFFMETNTSLFFIMQSAEDRETLKNYFADKVVQCPDTAKLNIITQQWREGQLTNWEYLTALNLISGRTYQDLMQYPVFPWVLSDYESSTLDLNAIENFRNFSKPIAIQHSDNEEHYVNSYNYLNTTNAIANQVAPYHYGSLYSNSGTVLHFLVRVPPFTSYFLRYQDNNFDLPDRTFHSVLTTWRLASRDSTTDVKELIPEFFTFPEILENAEGFNFGQRQSGDVVNNVALPPWAHDSPRLFTFVHRQALESDCSRKNMHRWIDLVFGWKQIGQAAVDAINVFHPATYYGFSPAEISDPVERNAMETMVRTYGQMPRTLFKSPHPAAHSIYPSTEYIPPVLPFIKGLHWGCYTGSPELTDPRVCAIYQQFEVDFSSLMSLANTNTIYAFSPGHNVMQGSEPDTMKIIQWQQRDGVIRIKPLRDSELYEHQSLTYNHHIDEITICGTDPYSNQLWFGHASGRITVYQCNSNASKYNKNRQYQHFTMAKQSYNSALRKFSMKLSNIYNPDNDPDGGSARADPNSLKWKDPVVLVRHTSSISGISISKEFKIVVTVSCDGIAVIWDANRLQYIRSIQRPSICKGPISLVAISPTLGDIVTVHAMKDGPQREDDRYSECFEATENIDDFVNVSMDLNGKSLLRLHTINAKYISHVTIPEKIFSVCYSSIKEGIGVNVIATGLEQGIIRLWSSWDLSLIREFMVSTFDVMSITYSTYQHLVILTSDNIVQVWDSPGLQGNPPKFPQVVFQKRGSF